MIDSDLTLSTVLVDVELPDPEPLPAELIRTLSPLRVVLLGWFPVPEQTSPAQARNQFRQESQATLDRIAHRFMEVGTDVTVRLVFTGDEFDTINRVSTEEECDAVLIPGPMEQLRRILVPMRGGYNIKQIAFLVATLAQRDSPTVTLFSVLEDEETDASMREDVLEPTAAQMREHGVDADLIEFETVAADDPVETIVERSSEYDLMVLGETEPSVREVLFGSVPARIADRAPVPVILMRHENA